MDVICRLKNIYQSDDVRVGDGLEDLDLGEEICFELALELGMLNSFDSDKRVIVLD